MTAGPVFNLPKVAADGRTIELPGWTKWQADVLLAGFFKRDREALERLRQQHRDECHAGFDGDQEMCVDCGFVAAALYDVQTGGRSLETDFLGRTR